jgi:Membrane dipeptidase (Peptidase family M19)/Molybdopterin-binding domain of aldehyde dehydrogenase
MKFGSQSPVRGPIRAYELGVRLIGLTWNWRNAVADGWDASPHPGGLTPFGLALVEEMGRLGMIVDVAHLGPASGVFIRCRMGATRAGKITAAEAFMAYEAGAFPGSPMGAGVNTGLAPYRIENLLVDGYDVVVNKPRVAPLPCSGDPSGRLRRGVSDR